MEVLITLQTDITGLKNKPTNDLQLEKQLYTILVQTGEEIISTVGKVIEFRKSMTFHNELDLLLEEVKECIEEIHENYVDVIGMSYNQIRLKRLFESLDGVIGEIDDFIERVNELFEAQNFRLNYIENWDISFFIENM